MQLIVSLPWKIANRHRPKPARIIPFVVMKIGAAAFWFSNRAASLSSPTTSRKLSSSNAGCSRNCFGERRTGLASVRLVARADGSSSEWKDTDRQSLTAESFSGRGRFKRMLRACRAFATSFLNLEDAIVVFFNWKRSWPSQEAALNTLSEKGEWITPGYAVFMGGLGRKSFTRAPRVARVSQVQTTE